MPRPLAPAALALALLALAPAAAPAQDLGGLWKVDGRLPGGAAYEGLVAVSPAGAGRYRVRVAAARADGKAVRLYGLARQSGEALEVRYRAGAGLATLVGGGAQGSLLVGRYTVAAGGAAFEGPLTASGAPAGRARYARQAPPTVTLAPASVEAELGARVTLTLRGPAGVLPLVSVRGPGRLLVTGQGGERRVRLDDLPAGTHRVEARLGTDLGALLGEVAVVVREPVVVSILDEVAAEVERLAADEPQVIFDLDDTLFETRTRSSTIVREFGQQQGDARLAACAPEHVRFGLEDTLRACGLSEAEVAGDLGRAVRRFWSPRFFNGGYLRVDTPLPGAAAYVRRLAEAGARIVYLSGRKEQARQGTLDALAAAGFPVGPGTTLHVKPDAAPGQPKLETHAWKGRTAREVIAPLGPVVAAFDNEPANCNALREALPQARVVFLDTLYAPDAPALAERVVRIEGRYE